MDCIELLRELIGFDTVNPPGNEKPAARYLAGILEPMGFKCEVQDLGGSRANLIAVLDGGAGPELMLNGHLDVVPAVGEWDSSPFSMEEKDGKLYGLRHERRDSCHVRSRHALRRQERAHEGETEAFICGG